MLTKIWGQFDPKDWLNPDQSSLAQAKNEGFMKVKD